MYGKILRANVCTLKCNASQTSSPCRNTKSGPIQKIFNTAPSARNTTKRIPSDQYSIGGNLCCIPYSTTPKNTANNTKQDNNREKSLCLPSNDSTKTAKRGESPLSTCSSAAHCIPNIKPQAQRQQKSQYKRQHMGEHNNAKFPDAHQQHNHEPSQRFTKNNA